MSQNIYQIYQTNPVTSNNNTDLMYFGLSPYTSGDDAAMTFQNFKSQFQSPLTLPLSIANGGTGVSSVTTTPTGNAWAGWDTNSNLSANNVNRGYFTTATAGGTTVLTVASAFQQFFTGTMTQTVTMPVTSTLVLGQSFLIVNNSTNNVTVQSSGGNTIVIIAGGTSCMITCILTSGTTAASWYNLYNNPVSGALAWNTIAGTSQAAVVNNAYVIGNASQTTVTLPAIAAFGSTIRVQGQGAGGWILAANTGQTIQAGTAVTSSGGSVTSNNQYDSIEVACIVANTTWSTKDVYSTAVSCA